MLLGVGGMQGVVDVMSDFFMWKIFCIQSLCRNIPLDV